MRIPKTKVKPCWFKGHDGKKYRGHTCGIINTIATVVYTVPGIGQCHAWVAPEDYSRITARAS